jgi:S1-C subfamily serine protease
MKTWKMAAAVAALVGAAGVGAAVAPVAYGQSSSGRAAVAPRAFELFTGGAHIGVTIADVEESDAKVAKGQAGVVVEDVSEDSPAAKAGIRKGDVIVEFDGERVRSVRQFQRMVQETPAGRNVQLALLRDGQRSSVSVAPAERNGLTAIYGGRDNSVVARAFPAPVVPSRPRTPTPAPPVLRDFEGMFWTAGNTLGVATSELSDQLGSYFGTKSGVLVTTVTPDSAADKAGVKAGDVITSFNGTEIDSSSELRRRIQRLDSGEEFTMGVMRDKKALTLKGKLEPRRDPRRTYRATI